MIEEKIIITQNVNTAEIIAAREHLNNIGASMKRNQKK